MRQFCFYFLSDSLLSSINFVKGLTKVVAPSNRSNFVALEHRACGPHVLLEKVTDAFFGILHVAGLFLEKLVQVLFSIKNLSKRHGEKPTQTKT